MIKVMIAEDNIFISKNCFKFLTNDKDIKVISCAYDGEETIKEYFKLQPDVLLLDLDMPKINGLDIINTIGRFTEERKKCNIIVVSGSTEHLYKLYKELNQKELKEILAELRLNIFSSRVQQLITAISLAYEKPYLLNNIKDLYIEVAKIYNISPKTIKWSIRTSIDTLNILFIFSNNLLYSSRETSLGKGFDSFFSSSSISSAI